LAKREEKTPLDAKILSSSVKADTGCARLPNKILMLQQYRNMACSRLKAAILACGLAAAAPVPAVDVEIRVSNLVSATADFRPGKTGKPAVLILHGFLQTRNFGIVRSLADALADAGYTVLSPTLSLGISYRKSSLNCEALHLHDMSGDIQEIQQWVQWLRSRGYARIFGIGHSIGATQLLAWSERHSNSDFSLIGISLASTAPFKSPAQGATPLQRKPAKELLHAPLSFCEKYTSPADKYVSYIEWDEKKILAAIHSGKTRTHVILGSADSYLPENWTLKLAKAGARTLVIKDANHFMEGTQEFDMLEATLEILKS
jgi:pimeloyl-ACP methyl ester carboxylesterase